MRLGKELSIGIAGDEECAARDPRDEEECAARDPRPPLAAAVTNGEAEAAVVEPLPAAAPVTHAGALVGR